MSTWQQKAQDLFKDKKVLILGLGINQGGLGATKFFANAGAEVKVTDLKTSEELKDSLDQLKDFPDISYTLGEHKLEDLDWADLIIKNPALKPGNQYIEYAESKQKQIDTDLGIFFQFVDRQRVIGVTGTKGKSTTASLIYEALKQGGVDIVFAGNIGKSVFDILEHVSEDTYVVLELSSAQLQASHLHKISPHIAVITNIYPDHLNYHGSMEAYIAAKRAIAEYQDESDYLFINKEDLVVNTPLFTEGLKTQIITYSGTDIPSTYQQTLPGEHNRLNYACAVKVAEIFNIDSQTTLTNIQSFTGVEFRLQLIKDWSGIKIYNDTAASSPQAAIENIKTLPNSIWIGGGVNKDLSYQGLAQALDEHAKSIYLLEGDATEDIKKHLNNKTKIKGEYNNLETLMADVFKEAKSGDIILFSPGAASFNLFKNEFDRGRQFNHAVENLTSN